MGNPTVPVLVPEKHSVMKPEPKHIHIIGKSTSECGRLWSPIVAICNNSHSQLLKLLLQMYHDRIRKSHNGRNHTNEQENHKGVNRGVRR